MILTVPSGNFHLSGIPLWVKVEGANPPAGCSRYRALLRISSVDGLLKGSPFTDAVAPVDGVAWFDVSGYLERPDTLRYEWPLSGGLNPYPEWTLDIRFTAGESYIDSAGNLQESYGSESDTHYVVKGGVGPRRLGTFNDLGSSFYQHYVTSGRFLTHFPTNMKVAPFQPVKLWFLAKETAEQTLRIKAYYEDGSTFDYSSSNTFFRDIMHEINCLPYHADSIHMPPVKAGGVRMSRYEVWIEGVSEVRSFVVDHSYRENSHYLLVANSLGGMDTVWLSGNTETGFESESIEAVRPFPRTGDGKERSVIVAARTGRRRWKINTGWKSRSEMEALSDVLLSRQAWLLENATGYNTGSLYPVTVKNTSSVLVNTSEDLLSLDIELSEAHNAQYL